MEQFGTGSALTVYSARPPALRGSRIENELHRFLSKVPSAKRDQVHGHLLSLQANIAESVQLAIFNGCILLALKKILDHGMFSEAYALVGRDKRSAQNDMRLALVFSGHEDLVSRYPLRLLNKLAGKSTPQTLRVYVIDRLEADDPPSPSEIEAMLEAAKAAHGKSSSRTARRQINEVHSTLNTKVASAATNASGSVSQVEKQAAARRAADMILEHFDHGRDELACLLEDADANEFLAHLVRGCRVM